MILATRAPRHGDASQHCRRPQPLWVLVVLGLGQHPEVRGGPASGLLKASTLLRTALDVGYLHRCARRTPTRFLEFFRFLESSVGGEGGIRTRDTLASMPHFECGAFNHSATSPIPRNGGAFLGNSVSAFSFANDDRCDKKGVRKPTSRTISGPRRKGRSP